MADRRQRQHRRPSVIPQSGSPAQERGAASSSPGLYFVGLPFLDSFPSMLVLGAGRDGERVAKQILSPRRDRRASVTKAAARQEIAA